MDIPSYDSIVQVRLQQAAHYSSQPVSLDAIHAQLSVLIENQALGDLKVLASRLLYDKFFASIDVDECRIIPATLSTEIQEIFINVGSDDGVTKKDVVEYFINTGSVKTDQIHKVRVIKKRTFICLPRECVSRLKTAVHGKVLKGRKTYICLAQEKAFSSKQSVYIINHHSITALESYQGY